MWCVRVFLLAFGVALALAPDPAAADSDQLKTTTLQQDGSHLELESCAASVTNGILKASFDFTNMDERTMTDLQFFFVLKNAFGQLEAMARYTAHGTYSTNAPIRGVQFTSRVSSHYESAVCTVAKIKFADGTFWDAGKGFLAGAVSTSTPSPTAPPRPI